MRIRKEISPWDGKMFFRLVLILVVILNGLIVLIHWLNGQPLLGSQYNWVLGLLQPILLASVFTYHGRKISLFINDFQNIDSFREKLDKNIMSQGTSAHLTSDTSSHYVATGWFYRLFHYWGGVETVKVHWGSEVVIEGSSRIISQVEDSLAWNAAFTSSRVTT